MPETRNQKMVRKAQRRARWHQEASNPRRTEIALKVGLYKTQPVRLASLNMTYRQYIIPSLGA